jgi:hypothetical protein
MQHEDVLRYTPRGQYPITHGASGYATGLMSAVRADQETTTSKTESSFSDIYRNWSGLVLSSLLVAWGGFLRW